jgi:hypothetical protein
MQVTNESCQLSIKHINSKHECSGSFVTKLSKNDAEEIACLSAVCLALVREVQAVAPISDDSLEALM